jgi:hypothetical protein
MQNVNKLISEIILKWQNDTHTSQQASSDLEEKIKNFKHGCLTLEKACGNDQDLVNLIRQLAEAIDEKKSRASTHRSKIDFNYENLKNDKTRWSLPAPQRFVDLYSTQSILELLLRLKIKPLCARFMNRISPVNCSRIAIRDRKASTHTISSALVALYLKRNFF